MGLSMAYGFAQQSEGNVYVKSSPGNGTEVALILPQHHKAKLNSSSPNIAMNEFLPRGTEKILIVEDESRVRKFALSCLQDLGYKITAVDSADSAHELLNKREHGFHALFSDIVMPGDLNGLQLAEWVKANRPEVGILLTTGYSKNVHGQGTVEFDVLNKPYSKADLANRLRQALDT